ncbi:glycosyltransferase [Tunturiibacter gelidoferens]|uniref:Ceramide glucosyltransferase n=1 Tax=Tunturiibacter lichenicola TaxID=2051959 RepID=A0A7Y9NNV2_9BACT|nr:glycosyltransferase [Edaphobacter lichenicola]NYF52825.1 ceramide glucosyltransferase [Edaphobacter lichenicola]
MSPILLLIARGALIVGIFGTLTSGVSFLLAFLGGLHFRSRRNDQGNYSPPVSILKPLHGKEAGLEENLESFFTLNHPEFELIFCARSLSDPGILCAQEVARRFPSIPTRFLASGEPLWQNPKTFSMSLLVEAAKHEVILFSDSDVRVGPSYLHEILQPLADPAVGLVTCAFRGQPAGNSSLLTALTQTVEFSSGVLTANLLEDIKFGLGPTLLTRKALIREIGGLKDIGDLLADDFWLGNRIADKGYKVTLSTTIVDHFINYGSIIGGLHHQISWMKNTRCSRPAGHLGSGLTFAMPFGIIGFLSALAIGRPVIGFWLLFAALVNRWLQALLIGFVIMRDKLSLTFFWLYPLCDLLGFYSWAASYFGREIVYRGERYRINPGGVLVRLGPL